ncbi:MAG: acyl-CoA dehydrogenase family protein [Gammaproteobacteria bacterium]
MDFPNPYGRDVLAEVESLLPLIARNAAAGEQRRQLTEETNEALREAGVFRMYTPRRFGGFESSLSTQFEVMRTLATADASTSWVAANNGVISWWCAHFPDSVQEEVWVDPDVQFCGSIKPFGTLVATNGGFILNGRFPFQTGSRHATWDLMTPMRILDDGTRDPYLVMVPIGDVKILDDWDVIGMSATGSCTVIAENVFVPTQRAIRAVAAFAGEFPDNSTNDLTLYRCALLPTLFAGSYATPIGAAQGMLATWLEWAPKRTFAWDGQSLQRDSPIYHRHAAEASMKIESALLLARTGTAHIWDYAERREGLSVEERIKARVDVAYATRLAKQVAELLWTASGATASHRSGSLQRFFRDIEVITQHAVLDYDSNMALYGRTLFGLESDSSFL